MALEERTARYRASIGKGLATEIIKSILELADGLTTSEYYTERSKVPFWYERQQHDTMEDVVTERLSKAADRWATNQDNIDRAAKAVNRATKSAHENLVLAFVIARIKELSDWSSVKPRWWKRGGGSPDLLKQPQTLVCVALEDLDLQNGLFMQLPKGQEICIDCEEDFPQPPGGGGLVILIWLKL